MEVLERALELERAGARVLHLEVGEPDFPPPPAAVAACREALGAGETRLHRQPRPRPLREAIAADNEQRIGVAVDPERVLVTSGTSPAMLLVFALLVEPGDEVADRLAPLPLLPELRPLLRRRAGLRAAATRRTAGASTRSACAPRSPSGRARSSCAARRRIRRAPCSRETLAALAELGLPLVSDEIYDGLVYDGARAPSALEVPDAASCSTASPSATR